MQKCRELKGNLMSYLTIEELLRLKSPERAHIRKVDDALRDVFTWNLMTATMSKLDEELIARATVTLVLASAAREALAVCNRSEKPFNVNAFARLARDVANWAQSRRQDTPAG
jgi:hypothetical protein